MNFDKLRDDFIDVLEKFLNEGTREEAIKLALVLEKQTLSLFNVNEFGPFTTFPVELKPAHGFLMYIFEFDMGIFDKDETLVNAENILDDLREFKKRENSVVKSRSTQVAESFCDRTFDEFKKAEVSQESDLLMRLNEIAPGDLSPTFIGFMLNYFASRGVFMNSPSFFERAFELENKFLANCREVFYLGNDNSGADELIFRLDEKLDVFASQKSFMIYLRLPNFKKSLSFLVSEASGKLQSDSNNQRTGFLFDLIDVTEFQKLFIEDLRLCFMVDELFIFPQDERFIKLSVGDLAFSSLVDDSTFSVDELSRVQS